ncbi:MAG: uroporphyrinogen decarboxylase [Acidothermus sp.]|nr:uroporphyrinogen decarboxylase [Acidothermus sp.]MCL6537128.1 uroporphyrinogen decarboxylase [Acidothermus sp.]
MPCDDERVSGTATTAATSPLLQACRGERPEITPVWFMRQAGRALPEYRAARGDLPMIEACLTSDLVVELTLQPVHRYRVDAAILFSDITVPLATAGIPVRIVPGIGPVLDDPIRTKGDVDRLPPPDIDALEPVRTAVRRLIAELGDVPLIGFAGGPFTLASYLVEGGPSRDQVRTKALMHREPATWHELAEKLGALSRAFLLTQIEAGARVVQLFDSWAGSLSPSDYRRYVLPHSAAVLRDLGVPRIHFGVGTGELLADLAAAGADVVGVDWRVPLDTAVARIAAATGKQPVVQGNLDPAIVFASWPAVRAAVLDVLARGRAARGHIFNLGHGVLPESDPGVLAAIVDLVHETSRRVDV